MEISFKDIHDAIVAEAKYGIPFPYPMKSKDKSLKIEPKTEITFSVLDNSLKIDDFIERDEITENDFDFSALKKAKPKKLRKIKRDISTERAKDLILEKKKAGCSNCGYNRYMGALEFHHLDPSTKSFSIGSNAAGKNLNEILEELSKCVLLCSNCHREVHGGLIKL